LIKEDKVLNYKSNFLKNETEVIAIDFDGVIHDNSLGYHDGTIYGNPVEGTLKSIKKIKDEGYRIIIYTCKAHPERPLVNQKTGTELIWDWLKLNNISQYIETVVWGKPHAALYIDDKGFRFKNWKNAIDFLFSEEFSK
jgi:histidinol phosphatase-like enzyme